ncbi:MAG: HD domain-containing protein [Gemmatimonadetes bacterium]|jgi:putative hydrolases of HD superfamily|nr:HD domain-containing protein [Gemmatimonadota bacterium]MBT5057943.1 HD domain-containing protein [Gemmatimonadota bacterium]MBT5144508.1 HD domain-containing protein [Gemmatimonadota bacterium]MBT5587964.1 HD domain-containing protein [Gemmatimonadota bacterium]MBT5960241.1 HD domain-containing protein [Gemmatimonadota bacterium]
MSLSDDRLQLQLDFVMAVDDLKHVTRQTTLRADGRPENDAEHSWHLALMAIVLAEHAVGDIDLQRVLTMHIIHDIVEIIAGDTFIYDEAGQVSKDEREREAAKQLFGLLPQDQGDKLRGLWEEFEERTTADSRYAASLDRLQPLLLNYHGDSAAWLKHGIRKEQVVKRNQHIQEGAPPLWAFAQQLIDRAVSEGKLKG